MFNTLKSTGEVLKSEQGAVKAEDIENVREDMEDLKDSQNEVNEMFSGYAEQGNEEVDDELAQMEKEMAEEVSLPSDSFHSLNNNLRRKFSYCSISCLS